MIFTNYSFSRTDKLDAVIELQNNNGEYVLISDDEIFVRKMIERYFCSSIYLYTDNTEYECNIAEFHTVSKEKQEIIISIVSLFSQPESKENFKLAIFEFRFNEYPRITDSFINFKSHNKTIVNSRKSNSKTVNFKVTYNSETDFHSIYRYSNVIRDCMKIYEGMDCVLVRIDCYNSDAEIKGLYIQNVKLLNQSYFQPKYIKDRGRFDLTVSDVQQYFEFMEENYEENSKILNVVSFYNRTSFENVAMYFKEIFSYYEQLLLLRLGKEKMFNDPLKKCLKKCFEENGIEDFDLTTVENKIKMISDITTFEKMKEMQSKRGIIIKTEDSILKSIKKTRDKLVHSPMGCEYNKYMLFAYTIFIRELIINIILQNYFIKNTEILETYGIRVKRLMEYFDKKYSIQEDFPILIDVGK